MESTTVSISRLKEKNKWVYSTHSQFSLQIEENISKTPFNVVPLGTLAEEVADGLHGVRNYVDDGIVMLAVGNITEYGLDLSEKRMVALEEHERLKRSQVQRGDLLVTVTGRLGTAMIYESDEPANLSAHVGRVKVKDSLVNPYYLAAYLNSAIGRQLLGEFSIGSIYPHININKLASVRVILPPQSLQDRIAQIMQAAYRGGTNTNKKTRQLLKDIERLILQSLGVDFECLLGEKNFIVTLNQVKNNRFDVNFHLPKINSQYQALQQAKNCKLVRLGDLLAEMANGATPKGASYLTEGIPFFRIQNIVPNGLDLSDIAYINRATHNIMKRSQTRPGDLLMTITGRVGTAAVVPESIKEGNTNQHIVIMRLKPNLINANYLSAVINSNAVSFQTVHRTTGTTRIALDYTAIKSLLIPVPSLEIQRDILQEVERCHSVAKRLRAEAETLLVEAKAQVEQMILGEG